MKRRQYKGADMAIRLMADRPWGLFSEAPWSSAEICVICGSDNPDYRIKAYQMDALIQDINSDYVYNKMESQNKKGPFDPGAPVINRKSPAQKAWTPQCATVAVIC